MPPATTAPDNPATLHPDTAWRSHFTRITLYVRDHDGRFPPNRSEDRAVAELGCWWVAQNIALNQKKMSPEFQTALAQLRAYAAGLVEAARVRRAAEVAEAARVRALAASIAAGAAGAVVAAEALKNPNLIPGDAAVLRLRVDHPDKSLGDLAQLAGMTLGQFTTKYYGALRRCPNSSSPLPKPLSQRILTPTEAADMIGVTRTTLSRWAGAGLIASERNWRGHRTYRGSEVLRVQEEISDGQPKAFREADQPRRRRNRQ